MGLGAGPSVSGRRWRGPGLVPLAPQGTHPPAGPSCGRRRAEATESLQGLRHQFCGALSRAGGSGSSPMGCFMQRLPISACARPCAGHRGHCHGPGLTWPCPPGAHSQVGELGDESVVGSSPEEAPAQAGTREVFLEEAGISCHSFLLLPLPGGPLAHPLGVSGAVPSSRKPSLTLRLGQAHPPRVCLELPAGLLQSRPSCDLTFT